MGRLGKGDQVLLALEQRPEKRHARIQLDAGDTGVQIVVTAPGFARKSVALDAGRLLTIRLEIAPVSDSITVTGSTIAAPSLGAGQSPQSRT